MQADLGVNPFKFGLVGASDTRTGMTTVEEENFFHKFTAFEPGPQRTEDVSKTLPDGTPALYGWSYGAYGLTAVWADENSRAAIWDAMARVGSTVNPEIPSWTSTIGAPELGVVWTDPDFNASGPAFYYARVIEIPTPRWTAYDAVKFKLELPEDVPPVIRERAYTSPIWYTP